jgi:hypothetical protein
VLSLAFGKSKLLESGGSMDAKLKLKEVDGRAGGRPLRYSIEKNPKGLQNSTKSPIHFLWEIVKAPATKVSLPLWQVPLWSKPSLAATRQLSLFLHFSVLTSHKNNKK